MELKDTFYFHALSAAGLANSLIGDASGSLTWVCKSLASGNRYVDGADTSAGNANHRLAQLVNELVHKGIIKGTPL